MTLPAQPSARVAVLLEKMRVRSRGRLIFALDATASREPTWDMAAQLQAALFEEAAKVGGLEVQMVWYRGYDECSHTAWTTDTCELAAQMSRIRCAAARFRERHVCDHSAGSAPVARAVRVSRQHLHPNRGKAGVKQCRQCWKFGKLWWIAASRRSR
jgi:hypothetical protein